MNKIPNACLIRAQEQSVRAEILNKDSAQLGHSRRAVSAAGTFPFIFIQPICSFIPVQA